MQNGNRPQFEIKNLNLKERDLNPTTQKQVRMFAPIKDSNLQDKGFESFNDEVKILETRPKDLNPQQKDSNLFTRYGMLSPLSEVLPWVLNTPLKHLVA